MLRGRYRPASISYHQTLTSGVLTQPCNAPLSRGLNGLGGLPSREEEAEPGLKSRDDSDASPA